MLKVKLQGQLYSIPSSIDDVSIGRFIALRNIDPNNHLAILHWALNDTPFIREEGHVEQELANIFALVQPAINEIYAFMNNKEKNDVPKTIEVLGSMVKIKGGLLNELPYWAYVVTKSIVIKAVGNEHFDPTDDIPRVLAHYLYKYVTNNDYTEARAEEFIDVVNDIPMKQAIQLGNFFLRKHQGLFPSSKSSLRQKLSQTILRRA